MKKFIFFILIISLLLPQVSWAITVEDLKELRSSSPEFKRLDDELRMIFQKIAAECKYETYMPQIISNQSDWLNDCDVDAQSYMKTHNMNKAQAYEQVWKDRINIVSTFLKTKDYHRLIDDSHKREKYRVAREAAHEDKSFQNSPEIAQISNQLHNLWNKAYEVTRRGDRPWLEANHTEWLKTRNQDIQSYMKTHRMTNTQAYAQVLKERCDALSRYIEDQDSNIYFLEERHRANERHKRERANNEIVAKEERQKRIEKANTTMGANVQTIVQTPAGEYVLTIGKGGPIIKGIQLGMEYAEAKKIYERLNKKEDLNGFFFMVCPFSENGFVARICIQDRRNVLDLFSARDFETLLKALFNKFKIEGKKISYKEFQPSAGIFDQSLFTAADQYFDVRVEKGYIYDCGSYYVTFMPATSTRPAELDLFAKIILSEKPRKIAAEPKFD